MPNGSGPSGTLDRTVLAAILDMTGGDIEFVDHLVDLFLADAARHVAALRDAADREDPAALVAPAHALRSRGLSVGAARLAALAREVETAGRAGDLDAARRRVDEVEAEIGPVRDALEDARAAEWGRG